MGMLGCGEKIEAAMKEAEQSAADAWCYEEWLKYIRGKVNKELRRVRKKIKKENVENG